MRIDLARDRLITPFGMATLGDRYLVDGESSPQQAFARAAAAFADDAAHAQRLYDYASLQWFMFSTPILSNGGTDRGMPISCFLGYTGDSRAGITGHYTESSWLASIGGGVGGYWGHVRSDGQRTSKGSRSNGTVPFIKVMDSLMNAFSQGTTRRGSYAAYQHISHPEVEEFVEIRKPTGDPNRRCLGTGFHHALVLTDAFMEAVEADRPWDLVDPSSKAVVKTVNARGLWRAVLETRVQTGEPYLMFEDAVHRFMPEPLRNLGLRVWQSNLCSEIVLPTGPDHLGNMRTAVCCLSSVNLAKWDEWRHDELFVGDLVRMLDNVLTYFIEHAPPQVAWATYAAGRSRDLGLGAMGFHSYLQEHDIAFESDHAKAVNNTMFRHLFLRAKAESRRLAEERGSPPDLAGTGLRNAHLLAIAPNATSSIICGETSPSIEPIRSNAFKQSTLSGSFLVKNGALEAVLDKYGYNDSETWKSIIAADGSVQHLEFLTDHEKMVFKTAFELDQHWIVEHAAVRQAWICQAQSVNLFFAADTSPKYLNSVHFSAWKKGLKSLYYLRSKSLQRADKLGVAQARAVMPAAPVLDPDVVACTSCEG